MDLMCEFPPLRTQVFIAARFARGSLSLCSQETFQSELMTEKMNHPTAVALPTRRESDCFFFSH